MDIAGFWVGYFEVFVSAVLVCFLFEVVVQLHNVLHQTVLKLLYINFLSFSTDELLPGREQVFYRNDTLIGMSENSFDSKVTPTIEPSPTVENPQNSIEKTYFLFLF
jgi:hypothetical protein